MLFLLVVWFHGITEIILLVTDFTLTTLSFLATDITDITKITRITDTYRHC